MPAKIIYNPNYPLNQISTNFFNKGNQSLPDFITNNFNTNGGNSLNNVQTSAPASTTVSPNLIAQILNDYGSGPISNGMQALLTINQCVVNSQPITAATINNQVIYGAGLDFRYLVKLDARDVVLKNLSMDTLLPYVSTSYQTTFYTLADQIALSLKNGSYTIDKYQSSLLQNSKTIARIISNGATV